MRLLIRKNDELIENINLPDKDEFYLGRSKLNDVVLRDPYVSRKHGKIFFLAGQWFLEDLNSDNGIKIHSKKIQRELIYSGTRFQIGPFSIEIVSEVAKKASAPRKTKSSPNDLHAVDEFSELTPPIPIESATDEEGTRNTAFFEEDDSQKTRIEISTDEGGALSTSQQMKAFLEKQSGKKLKDAIESNLSDESEKTIASANDKVTPAEKKRRLVALDGKQRGQAIPLDKGEITIGSSDADVIIDEEENPSRATIQIKEDATLIVSDEVSRTLVDGKAVEKKELKNRDIVQIGDSRFEYLEGDELPSPHTLRVEKIRIPFAFLYHPFFDQWKRALFISFVVGTVLGVSAFVSLKKYRSAQADQDLVINPDTEIDLERERIFLFHLAQAEKLMRDQKFDEAEGRIKFVLDSAPQNSNAQKLLQKLNNLRAEEQERIRKLRLEIATKHTKIRELLEKGDRLVREKNFKEALKAYHAAKEIDPENIESRAALEHLEQVKEEEQRLGVAREKELTQIRRMFKQGMEDYESGKYTSAEKLMKQVIQDKDHPYYAPARNMLNEMKKNRGQRLSVQIQAAKSLVTEGDFQSAFKRFETLARAYPQNKEIKSEHDKVYAILENKAKEAFREGLTLLEIANDPASALDQFDKAMRLAPNEQSEYYKKSAQKVSEIRINP